MLSNKKVGKCQATPNLASVPLISLSLSISLFFSLNHCVVCHVHSFVQSQWLLGFITLAHASISLSISFFLHPSCCPYTAARHAARINKSPFHSHLYTHDEKYHNQKTHRHMYTPSSKLTLCMPWLMMCKGFTDAAGKKKKNEAI